MGSMQRQGHADRDKRVDGVETVSGVACSVESGQSFHAPQALTDGAVHCEWDARGLQCGEVPSLCRSTACSPVLSMSPEAAQSANLG